MTEVVIQATGLTRKFSDVTAVNALDLRVERGQIYGFLGPNGCGKSTTIRLLTGLLTPSEGEVEVLGYQLPQQAEALRQNVGYMTQQFSLYQDLSVVENLRFVARIFGITGSKQQQRIAQLLQQYHLQNKADRRASALSGGQRQRLALAAAVVHKPQLLFLDEPTAAVDPENRRDFWERLFDLSDAGTTILVSTHYMDEAERCHRIAILEQGHKRAEGEPEQLMRDLPCEVFELRGDGLRKVRKQLMQKQSVLSTAQIGQSLRVLVNKQQQQPQQWLEQQLPSEVDVQTVRPSLEDVFVANTGTRHVSRD